MKSLEEFFFQIGLLVSVGLTLVAFEWTSSVKIAELPYSDEIFAIDDIEIPPIIPEKIIEKPLVKITAPKPSNTFTIVDDNKKIEDPIEKEKEKEPLVLPKEFKKVPEDVPEDEPIYVPQVMPEMVGGLNKYLGENLKYPVDARKLGIGGKVYVQFIVGKNGEIRDIKILKGVNKLLDKEAIRVVEAMPNWKPGKQHGRPVSVIYNLPIHFKLK